jgi:hypothetical protein
MQLRRLPGLGSTADRLSTSKVRLARRVTRRANPKVNFIGIRKNVVEPDAARNLIDCDFLFFGRRLPPGATDLQSDRPSVPDPGIQIGTRIEGDEESREVGDTRGHVRLDLPDQGCLRCAGLIGATKVSKSRREHASGGGQPLPRRDSGLADLLTRLRLSTICFGGLGCGEWSASCHSLIVRAARIAVSLRVVDVLAVTRGNFQARSASRGPLRAVGSRRLAWAAQCLAPRGRTGAVARPTPRTSVEARRGRG